MAGVEQPPVLSTRRVLEAVARHLGTDVGTLQGRERTSDAAVARRVAIAILRERCRAPYRQIGQLLGRHHATVIQAHQRAHARGTTAELVEHVARMLDQENPRTQRAVRDVEEAFRLAREQAGLATQPRGRTR